MDDFPEIIKHKPADHSVFKFGGYWFDYENIKIRRDIILSAIQETEIENSNLNQTTMRNKKVKAIFKGQNGSCGYETNKEYDLIINIPSPAGELTYYCKAKSSKRVSDGDLSSAVLKAQSKRLPALFLTTGELTKKAEEALKAELKNQIKVMKI